MSRSTYRASFDNANRAWDSQTREFKKAVFDQGHNGLSSNPATRIGLASYAGVGGSYVARRTEADRRPRRSFIRENDGPDPNREARSALILATVERRNRPVAPKTEERRGLVLKALMTGAMNNTTLAKAINLDPNVTSGVVKSLVDEGLATRTKRIDNKCLEVIVALTDAGQDVAEGLGG